jgi:ribonuclease E
VSAHERERLSAYLDGELAPAERATVETHLAGCPECNAFLAELAAVDEAAAALPVDAPEGYFDTFPARVRARLQPAGSRVRARTAALQVRSVPAWTWAVAAALLLAVITPLTLRQARPAAPAQETRPSDVSSAPAAIVMPPRQKLGVEPAEPKAPAAPPPASRPRPSPPAAVRGSERPLAMQRPAPTAAPEARRDQPTEGRFAAEPAAPPQRSEFALAREQTAADAETEGAAGGAVGGVLSPDSANRDKVERTAPRAAVAAEAASPMTSAASAGHEATPAGLKAQADSFRRLEAVRPRSAAGWRSVREQWKALAATETDPVRADEARVRAVIAAREAWRAEGDVDDEAAFRAEALSYLRRGDARQKPRVEALLGEAPRTP